MAFVGVDDEDYEQFDSIEEMYKLGGLPRTSDAVKGLWTQQGKIFETYLAQLKDADDLAIELPTGTGKTLTGLLIAEWNRRKSGKSILYAVPTVQLARQVELVANAEGIPAVVLAGDHRDWSPSDESEVSGGVSVGITTYSSLFNSSPKVPRAELIILDDAHAGEQFVGEQYGVVIRRNANEHEYGVILQSLRSFFTGLELQRLEGDPDPGAHHQVRMLLPGVDDDALRALDEALSKLKKPFNYQLSMIRAGLASSCVFISYGGIQIRPMIPPTFTNRIFAGAKQRIYLSATLGAGGELERAFGRPKITRLPQTAKSPPRSGRRLFVFSDIVDSDSPTSVIQEIIDITDKALVLSQSTSAAAEQLAEDLANEDMPIFDRDSINGGLKEFSEADKVILGLANRYDGMDFPDESCRVIVLDGLPDAVSLQERFLSERIQAHEILSERLRSRLVQGAGRCTRGPNDYAVVIVSGSDITRHFSRKENRRTLEPEIQGEVEFGWANSKGQSSESVLDNTESFLAQNSAWQYEGEAKVAKYVNRSNKVTANGAHALATSAANEVEAWHLAFRERWKEAAAKMEEAARSVGIGGEDTRNYRGLLLYLAGVWLSLGAQTEAERARSRELVRNAGAASNRGTWIGEMKDLPNADEPTLDRVDEIAISEFRAKLSGKLKPAKLLEQIDEMVDRLHQRSATDYEVGLTSLGAFLGAEAYKPGGSGRCDSAWKWGSVRWLSIEAKSEEHPDGLLPLKDIRQTNTQLDQMAADADLDYAPAESQSFLICDRLAVPSEHAQVAKDNVYLVRSQVIESIAYDVRSVWKNLLGIAGNSVSREELDKHIGATLAENGCLPNQIFDRLMQYRIKESS